MFLAYFILYNGLQFDINKLEEKSYYHLNRCRSNFWQNSISFYDKILNNKVSIEGLNCNITKAISYSWYHTKKWKAESISSKIKRKTRMPHSPLLFNTVLEVSRHSYQTKKEIKKYELEWRYKTVTTFRWHCTIYRESYDTTRNLLILINEFNKVAEYKVNIQKSAVFLFANNKLSQKLRK